MSTLEVVEVGADEDGDALTSCVIVASEAAPVTGQKKTKLSPSVEVALRALKEAIGEGGELPPASNHIPAGVRTVSVELWRKFAYARDSENKPDAKRQSFGRASKQLQFKGFIGVWQDRVWLIEA